MFLVGGRLVQVRLATYTLLVNRRGVLVGTVEGDIVWLMGGGGGGSAAQEG